jgi:(E)-4-hydroxy-3-methylbut-2-enyl-diphosphate synthase
MPSRRAIMVGAVPVGGGAPVAVQSMTCTRTGDAAATLAQVRALVVVGCEIVRVSLPTAEEAPAFARVVAEAPCVPIIADIHYDWRLALAAIEAGAAAVRINPGTMAEKHVREIVAAAASTSVATGGGAEAPVAIRIGVNAGSLPRDLRDRASEATPATLVEAALRWADKLEGWDFTKYKLSVKSSSVPATIAAYRLLAERSDAPLHVGVTEAGTVWSGSIKSAVGIGALLADGIGDTIRVSLTGDPVEEVRVAWQILAALKLRRRGPEVISCPTCGRTEVDIVGLAEAVERRLGSDAALAGRALTVAVMGCRVNGPEEARHADYGIAAGAGEGVLFDHGERVATLPEGQLLDALLALIHEHGE